MAGSEGRRRVAGWVVNGAMRAAIIGFVIEAATARADDPRFAGKGIPIRNLVFGGGALTLAFPLLHRSRRPWDRYPVWADALFLSILALDMAGNSLNLYERGWRFDLIPHTYGPAAGVATLRVVGVDLVPGALLVNAGHLLLEIQEALGDALFGTHNVHGWWDTISDLGAGLVGSIGIPLLVRRTRRRLAQRHRSYSVA
ncbi:MAG TPA: hypothetical protein VFM03_06215 [Candidatus Limnocylindria bacterium]|jgi:hypothetical protein|nr:hypothetical protein [Candidatus Limnocylindria bacterium]